jgi:hypothetical protein
MIDEEKQIPVISTSSTSGLASILQLTDDTPNEIFTIRHSKSETETIIILEPSPEDEDKDEEVDQD